MRGGPPHEQVSRTDIVNSHRTSIMYCIKCTRFEWRATHSTASELRLSSLATYEFDSAIFRLNLGNSLYNVVFISEHGVSEFGFIFFGRVSLKRFLKLRATRAFYTGEITGDAGIFYCVCV